MPSTAQALSGAPAPRPDAFELTHEGFVVSLPLTVYEAGERAAYHSLEFFAARLPNPNTRLAYGHAVAELCRWCSARGLVLSALSSLAVASYFQERTERLSPASANQHLTGIRQWLEWLTRSGLPSPEQDALGKAARSVCRARHRQTPLFRRGLARIDLQPLLSSDGNYPPPGEWWRHRGCDWLQQRAPELLQLARILRSSKIRVSLPSFLHDPWIWLLAVRPERTCTPIVSGNSSRPITPPPDGWYRRDEVSQRHCETRGDLARAACFPGGGR